MIPPTTYVHKSMSDGKNHIWGVQNVAQSSYAPLPPIQTAMCDENVRLARDLIFLVRILHVERAMYGPNSSTPFPSNWCEDNIEYISSTFLGYTRIRIVFTK